jgi:hypothetical protein
MTVTGPTIYLETSALWAAGWPRVSANIERLGSVARVHRNDVFLPEIVEIELEEGWLREFMDKTQGVTSRVKEGNRWLLGVVDLRITIEVPDLEALRKGYRLASEAAKEILGARSAPVTSRHVKSFAAMAARRDVPFKDRDEGFRDAVIFWSMIDHVVELGRTSCFLIAQDEIFSKPELIKAAKEANITLRVYKGIGEFIDDAQRRLGVVIRKKLMRDQERARAALLGIREDIEKFIIENVVFMENDLAPFLATLVGIKSIALKDIQNVRVSVDIPLPITDKEVKVSFEAAIDVHVIVERFPSLPPRAVRVGEELRPASVGGLEHFLSGPQPFEEVRDKTIEMEASAVRTGAGNYEQVRLEAARLRRGLGDLLGAVADRETSDPAK